MEDNEAKKSSKLLILKNKKILISLAIVLGLVLILLFLRTGTTTTTYNKTSSTKEQSFDEYVDYTETRIKNIISSINGVGAVKVLISTDTSIEVCYAKDVEKKEVNETEYIIQESVVYEKNGSSSSGLIIYKKYPKINGILVVAEGANDEKVRIMIINALSAVFDVDISKIEVLAGKK